jgi:hypothetical protein
MSDNIRPFGLPDSERQRRAFLARVEAALRERGVADLLADYRPVRMPEGYLGPLYSELVITQPDVPGEARVAAVSVTQHFVSTRPGGNPGDAKTDLEPVLEGMRQTLRHWGIAGVTGAQRSNDPFPGDGRPEYELTIFEPGARVGVPGSHAPGDELVPAGYHASRDPDEIAAHIVAWRDAALRRAEPSPRGERDLAPLRVLARARREALDAVDWEQVERLREGGQLAEAWRAAGVVADFDPDGPDALRLAVRSASQGFAERRRVAQPDPAELGGRLMAALQRTGAQVSDPDLLAGGLAGMLQQFQHLGRNEPDAQQDGADSARDGMEPTSEELAALRDDLRHLSPRQLLWHYPRDARGRLPLGEQVLLAPCGPAPTHPQGRRLWLVAASPAKRRDPQVLTVRLLPVIDANHAHRWDAARWLWDDRLRDTPPAERWGVADLPLADLGLDAWRERLDRFSADATATPTERAARCILLQDAGRLAEALSLYDVELTLEVEQLLEGRSPGYGWHDQAAAWGEAVQEGLRACAPWRFAPLLAAALEAQQRRVTEKRSRKWKAPVFRLFRLPHQTQQSKAMVVLTVRDRKSGRPQLALDWSASNERLPLVAWQRDTDLDLLRFGLIELVDLP